LHAAIAQDPAETTHQVMLAFGRFATASARSGGCHAQSRQSMRLASAS
jgi:hypothetical protein